MAPPRWEDEENDETSLLGEYEDDELEDDDLEDEDEFYDGDDDLEDLEDDYDSDDDDLEDDDLEALIDEGEALIEEGEYTEALRIFREATERFPESPYAHYHVGQTALMMFSDGLEETPDWEDDDDLSSLNEEAQTAFDSALSIDEDFYPALNGQGALFMVLGNHQAAVEYWEKSLSINPDQEDIVEAVEEAKKQS
jgi:tetratricopeptide (TPR) repeat protein